MESILVPICIVAYLWVGLLIGTIIFNMTYIDIDPTVLLIVLFWPLVLAVLLLYKVFSLTDTLAKHIVKKIKKEK